MARPVGGKLMVQLHELRKDEARDVGLLIEAEEIDNSPLKKNPKQAVERKVFYLYNYTNANIDIIYIYYAI